MRAFEAAQKFFDKAAEQMDLSPPLRDSLLMAKREVQVQVSIELDNGELAKHPNCSPSGSESGAQEVPGRLQTLAAGRCYGACASRRLTVS